MSNTYYYDRNTEFMAPASLWGGVTPINIRSHGKLSKSINTNQQLTKLLTNLNYSL